MLATRSGRPWPPGGCVRLTGTATGRSPIARPCGAPAGKPRRQRRTEMKEPVISAPTAPAPSAGLGLDEAEAARRITVYGPRVLRPYRERAIALQFLARFGNPLTILLLVAATISAFTGDVASFVIIALVVVRTGSGAPSCPSSRTPRSCTPASGSGASPPTRCTSSVVRRCCSCSSGSTARGTP